MSVSIDLLLGSRSILCLFCLKLKFVGWFVEVLNKSSVRCKVVSVRCCVVSLHLLLVKFVMVLSKAKV